MAGKEGLQGDKGLPGICRESGRGDKGEAGPKGDSCLGGNEFEGKGNVTYIGPKGEKGMLGMKVNLTSQFKLNLFSSLVKLNFFIQ